MTLRCILKIWTETAAALRRRIPTEGQTSITFSKDFSAFAHLEEFTLGFEVGFYGLVSAWNESEGNVTSPNTMSAESLQMWLASLSVANSDTLILYDSIISFGYLIDADLMQILAWSLCFLRSKWNHRRIRFRGLRLHRVHEVVLSRFEIHNPNSRYVSC